MTRFEFRILRVHSRLAPLVVTAVVLLQANFSFASGNEWSCTSPATIAHSLAKVELANEAWVKSRLKANPSSYAKDDLDGSHEGRNVELFSAELLPKENFAVLYRQCWVYLVDFEQSLKTLTSTGKETSSSALGKSRDGLSKQNELFQKWDNCVTVSLKPLPAEASELKACWEKVSGHSGL